MAEKEAPYSLRVVGVAVGHVEFELDWIALRWNGLGRREGRRGLREKREEREMASFGDGISSSC